MVGRFIVLFLSLLIFSNSAQAQVIFPAPLESAYESLCGAGGIAAQSRKAMCAVVRNSSICEGLEEQQKISCDRIDEFPSPGEAVWGCLRGLGQSVMDLLSFIWMTIKAFVGGAISVVTGGLADTLSAAAEHFESVRLYMVTEYEKAYAETSGIGRSLQAAKLMAEPIGAMIWNMVRDFVQVQYKQLACLNQEEEARVMCRVLGDIFIPPAGLVALIKKGPAAFKQFPHLATAIEGSRRFTKRPASRTEPTVAEASPVTTKPPNLDEITDGRFKVTNRFEDEKGRTINEVERTVPIPDNRRPDEYGEFGLASEHPEFARQLGMRVENGRFQYPGNASSMNSHLEDLNRAIPAEDGVAIRTFSATGEVSTETMARRWVNEAAVPYADRGDLHFHDLQTHFHGYMSMPQSVVAKSRKNMGTLLQMIDDPVLSKNKYLKDQLEFHLRSSVAKLDSAPVFALAHIRSLGRTIDLESEQLDFLKNRWGDTIPSYKDLLASVEAVQGGLSRAERRALDSYMRKDVGEITESDVISGLQAYHNRIDRFAPNRSPVRMRGITPLQRVTKAGELLGRKLSEGQGQALQRAHVYGRGPPGKDGSPARVGNYTPEQLRSKARILKEAGFSRRERETLIRRGVAGDLAEDIFQAPVTRFEPEVIVGNKGMTSVFTENSAKHSSQHIAEASEIQIYLRQLEELKRRIEPLSEREKRELEKKKNEQDRELLKELKVEAAGVFREYNEGFTDVIRNNVLTSFSTLTERSFLFEAIKKRSGVESNSREPRRQFVFIKKGGAPAHLRDKDGMIIKVESIEEMKKKIEEFKKLSPPVEVFPRSTMTQAIDYEFVKDGEKRKFTVVTCRSNVPCPDDRFDGREFSNGEVITVIPTCGPEVVSIPRGDSLNGCAQEVKKTVTQCFGKIKKTGLKRCPKI